VAANWSDAAISELFDGIHGADLKHGGIGYLDPKQKRVATRDWAVGSVMALSTAR